jgi:hypothetical protein
VPDNTPVVVSRFTPVGSAPVLANVGAGKPVAVTAKLPSEPTVNVVALGLVIAGGSMTVNGRVAGVLTFPARSAAVTVNVCGPTPKALKVKGDEQGAGASVSR